MTHIKRQSAPKGWPIIRKGTKFVVKPLSKNGIPFLIVLRDLLKIAKTRREVKRAIHKKYVLINNKPALDEKIGMAIFDTLSIIPSKKHYRIVLSDRGKFEAEEIKEAEAGKKPAKIIGKKILNGKKVQLNFNGGINLLSEIKCKIDDSALINLKEKKIEKFLPLTENANVIIFAGKHSGKKGRIEEINKEKKMALVDTKKGKLNILTKQLMAVE